MDARKTVVSVVLLLGLLTGAAAHAVDTLTITPGTDPGGLAVGDTLQFRVSVDSVTPPAGDLWSELDVIVRAIGPDNLNFSGVCADLSNLPNTSVSCRADTNGAFWEWAPIVESTTTVAGDLFEFTVLFDQAGTYQIFVEQAFADFVGGSGRLLLTDSATVTVTVTVADTPTPATLEGFSPPVENPGVATNVAKAGQTIPLKFFAATDAGPITDLASAELDIAGVACENVLATLDPIEQYVAAAATTVALQNLGGGFYQYNWKTAKSDAGTCQLVTLSLPSNYAADSLVAVFRFRK